MKLKFNALLSALYLTKTGIAPPPPARLTVVVPALGTNFFAASTGLTKRIPAKTQTMDIRINCIIINCIMNKKIIIFLSLALIVISVSGLFFGRILKMKQSVTSPSPVTPTPVPVELETWKDQSEFEFKYPKNLSLNPHPEDTENYAHLELTSAVFPGSVILWAKDSKYATVNDYVSGNKIAGSIESTLGDLSAVKIMDPENSSKYSILTVRKGYLYQIEVDSRGDKNWTDIFNLIADSYKFNDTKALEKPAAESVAAPAASDEIYTEEEVIE